jgi:hypothetical protein
LLDKHVPVATGMYTTIEELLEGVFSTQSMLRLYNEDQQKISHELYL